MCGRTLRRRVGLTAALLSLVWLLSPAQAADSKKVKLLRSQAEAYERVGDWDKACGVYEKILSLDRNLPEVRARYRICLRHYHQVQRHRDSVYLKEVLGLKYTQALQLYEVVLRSLMESSLDRHKVDPGRLFLKGLEEFRNALADPVFCQTHLRGLRPEQTRDFRNYLQRTFGAASLLTREQVIDQVREVASRAQHGLQLSATAVIMEFACGACHAYDDYTVYLTPNQFRELVGLLRGEFVGVGLRLTVDGDRLLIAEILPDSPAHDYNKDPREIPLAEGDEIVGIDRRPTAGLTAEAAMKLLEGEVDTAVELLVASPGMASRAVTLRRRTMAVPSVLMPPRMLSGAIGYVKIHCFQETTLQELDTALLDLNKQGMKALVLDLRDNPGGLFEVAVEVARRFLAHGVIVSLQQQGVKSPTPYQARNPAALALPLVLLVDGNTASSAEVLAGALKENKRA